MAIKVTLRKKKISKGRFSLYLDFYPPITREGKTTRREFLGFYLLEKPKTPLEKTHNSDTLKIAESIKIRRENELNKPEIYSSYEKEQLLKKQLSEKCFLEFFKALAEKKRQNYWKATLNQLIDFSKGKLQFAELNERLLERFKEYITAKELKPNTAQMYFTVVKIALKQAYRDGFLDYNLSEKINQLPKQETQRNYLSLEELNKLVETKCKENVMKRAALFSALTGLRFSDIQKLVWDEVRYSELEGGYSLHFRQKKTKGIEVLPISKQAYELLGNPQEPTKKVFEGLKYRKQIPSLYKWIADAGITRKITFHCFRHTFATVQLSHGTDLYTVSKLLGHKDLKTTQIYAKVISETKRKAVEKIKLDM